MTKYKAPYDHIALVYDHWQANVRKPFNKTVYSRIRHEIRRHGIKKGNFLDIACGTGTIMLNMAKNGWKVWGADSSVMMIDRAKKKFEGLSIPVQLHHQKVEELDLPAIFQLVGMFYDSVNHITSQRMLTKGLKKIFDHLLPGGLFLFDVNTLPCYKSMWNITSVGHYDDYSLTIENIFYSSKKIGESHITVFEKKNGEVYEKKTTVIRERWYSQGELTKMLVNAGFTILKVDPLVISDESEEQAYKSWWVCGKGI